MKSAWLTVLVLAMIGGLANIAWYILVAFGLFHLSRRNLHGVKAVRIE